MQEDKNTIYQMRFPQKLWYLLSLRPDVILWGGTGRTILLNYRILQSYLKCDHSVFKTTNMSSFVRQLNLYGFRKVTSHLQDPICNSSNPYMHEYVHDYFQYGRPELLNKITRKVLTMKRNFKPKMCMQNGYNNIEQMLCMTPLQKARHALHIALKKASHELFSQETSRQLCTMQFECEDSQDEFCEDEESFEFDWMPRNNPDNQNSSEPVISAENLKIEVENPISIPTEQVPEVEERQTFRDTNPENVISFTYETSQNNCDSFATSFLNMPDLDSVPTDPKTGVELLAEFNIDSNIDDGIARKLDNNGHGSLNCILPCISQDPNDVMAMTENHDNMNHYDGEWDQMFDDMIDKSSNQECASELKELYSQISKTIDLLNS